MDRLLSRLMWPIEDAIDAWRWRRARRRPPAVQIRPAPTPSPTPSPIFAHQPHPHTPRNVNDVHKAERSGANQRIAVFLTAYVGTMQTAYGFAALAIIGLLGVLAILSPSVYTLIAWLSQTFIQLVLLPVIMVGQNVLNRHAELQADEMYHNVVRLLHEATQHQNHLTAQDRELLAHRELLATLAAAHGTAPTEERPTAVYPVVPAKPPRKRAAKSAPTGQAS